MPYVTLSAGGREYRLRLTAKATVDLEKKLGRNPVSPFLELEGGRLPTLTDMAAILHAALQPLEHGITEAATYEIMDRYFEDGHSLYDLAPVMTEVFRVSGLIPSDGGPGQEADGEKNG